MADRLRDEGAENQVKGGAKELGGRLRNAAGALTGDDSQQLHGKLDELKGKAQRKLGEVQSDLDRDRR